MGFSNAVRGPKGPERQKATGLSSQEGANWRQAVDRAEKRELVTDLNGAFASAGSVVVATYAGITVAQMNDLRGRMRAAGGTVKVAKNRLAKIALQGTESEGIQMLFKGQTLIAYSTDPVAAPKVASDFAKTNDKLVILGGAMGKTALDAEGVKALATLPSLDELRGKLVGLIAAPATKIAQIVNAPAAQLARVFGAYARKDEAA
jgi:large subunit ribosomal protein L10